MFDFVHDDRLGMYTVSGPDGADTVVTVDEAGRAAVVEQEANWASYTYDADGRVDSVSRGNGTFTEYAYDFENLTMAIEHYGSNGMLMLGLEYAFTTNGLVAGISESNTSGLVATTSFTHDVRGRLTEENRVGTDPYLATYDYDDNGNRTSDTLRIGEVAEPGVSMIYQYSGNRLTEYMKRVGVMFVEQGTYSYDENGNVSLISREDEEDWLRETEFEYDKMGRLWRVLEYEQLLPSGPRERIAAREFRYGSARQRLLTRELDPSDLNVVLSETWSDYVGDSIYSDYTVNGGIATEQTRYLPGHWQTDVQAATTAFVHTNMLGTTRLFSNNNGTAIPDTSRLYTAFGVPVTTPGTPLTRYGYAGKWGYQEHSDFPFLHVGHRYYDPYLGRFLQRDPIGIFGGTNVYEYAYSMPTIEVDPDGLMPPGSRPPYMPPPPSARPKPKLKTPPPPKKPNPNPAPGSTGIKVQPLPRPQPWPKDSNPVPPGYLPGSIMETITICVNWARLYAMWMPAEDDVILCFVAGTKVYTGDGAMAIDKLLPGSTVLGCCVATQDEVCNKILAVHSSWTYSLVHVTLRVRAKIS